MPRWWLRIKNYATGAPSPTSGGQSGPHTCVHSATRAAGLRVPEQEHLSLLEAANRRQWQLAGLVSPAEPPRGTMRGGGGREPTFPAPAETRPLPRAPPAGPRRRLRSQRAHGRGNGRRGSPRPGRASSSRGIGRQRSLLPRSLSPPPAPRPPCRRRRGAGPGPARRPSAGPGSSTGTWRGGPPEPRVRGPGGGCRLAATPKRWTGRGSRAGAA